MDFSEFTSVTSKSSKSKAGLIALGRVLRLQGDITSHGILFSYTVEALVRGHPREVKKLRVRNWSWPLMGKKDRVCMGVKKDGVL